VGEEIKLTDSYLYRDSIREVEGRRYDGDEKAWYIPFTEHNVGLLLLLGAAVDGELLGRVAPKGELGAVEPVQFMPIRAAPYSHQIAAFNFAMRIFGLAGSEDEKGGGANDV